MSPLSQQPLRRIPYFPYTDQSPQFPQSPPKTHDQFQGPLTPSRGRSTTETLADVMSGLRHVFPHGHQDFIRITVDEIELHSRKNKDYAEGGDPLGNFRRTETIKRLYPGFDWASDYGGAADYMLKQVDAVLWSLAHQKGTECESLDDKLRDISVYAKLIRIMLKAREVLIKTPAQIVNRFKDLRLGKLAG